MMSLIHRVAMDNYLKIEDAVKEVLAKHTHIDPAKIAPDMLLVEELGLDSFGAVEIIFDLEEKFDVKIPDESVYQAKTVKDIVDFLVEQNTR